MQYASESNSVTLNDSILVAGNGTITVEAPQGNILVNSTDWNTSQALQLGGFTLGMQAGIFTGEIFSYPGNVELRDQGGAFLQTDGAVVLDAWGSIGQPIAGFNTTANIPELSLDALWDSVMSGNSSNVVSIVGSDTMMNPGALLLDSPLISVMNYDPWQAVNVLSMDILAANQFSGFSPQFMAPPQLFQSAPVQGWGLDLPLWW